MLTGQAGDYVAPGTIPLSSVSGVDRAVDQVARAQHVMAANPGLLITTPSQNGTNHYAADFAVGDAGSGCIHHRDLKSLLDQLAGVHGFTE